MKDHLRPQVFQNPVFSQGHVLQSGIIADHGQDNATHGIRNEVVAFSSISYTLKETSRLGRNQDGYQVRLRPFMGVMGMPPNEPGLHPSWPPRIWGGNLDCKELIAGSTLYLPIPVPLALFSVGDGHAAQADGEVSSTGIECPMERVVLQFELDETRTLGTPWANTPVGWITLGFHEDLHEASMMALDAMVMLMGQQYGLARQDAVALASLVVDLHITQLVNAGVRGVHAILPHGALARA